jgi:hypothetical protein
MAHAFLRLQEAGNARWKPSMARDEVGFDPMLSSESGLRPVSMVPFLTVKQAQVVQ